ncbi:MAG: hypothetical protein ACM3UW_01180 [Bacillota bacterium]
MKVVIRPDSFRCTAHCWNQGEEKKPIDNSQVSCQAIGKGVRDGLKASPM